MSMWQYDIGGPTCLAPQQKPEGGHAFLPQWPSWPHEQGGMSSVTSASHFHNNPQAHVFSSVQRNRSHSQFFPVQHGSIGYADWCSFPQVQDNSNSRIFLSQRQHGPHGHIFPDAQQRKQRDNFFNPQWHNNSHGQYFMPQPQHVPQEYNGSGWLSTAFLQEQTPFVQQQDSLQEQYAPCGRQPGSSWPQPLLQPYVSCASPPRPEASQAQYFSPTGQTSFSNWPSSAQLPNLPLGHFSQLHVQSHGQDGVTNQQGQASMQ